MLVRAELRGVFSPDVPDLRSHHPPDDEPWSVFVQLLVGPSGADGEESFGVVVCNGAWLESRARDQGPVLGRHHLVVASFAWGAVEGFVESYLERCVGETWDDVAQQVARLGHWEFEDYQA